METNKIIFGKIHYNGLFGQKFKDDIFGDLIFLSQKDKFIENDGYKWFISDVREIQKGYIFGKITKLTNNETEIVDEKTKERSNVVTQNSIHQEARFIIDIKKHIIGFEKFKILTQNQFLSAIQKIYENTENERNITIDFIYNEDKIREELKKLKRISWAKMILKTTNPESREAFKQLDDLFQATNSSENRIIQKAPEGESLNVDNKESLLNQSIAMSAFGYGDVTIRGVDENDKITTITTSNKNLKEIVMERYKNDQEFFEKTILSFDDIK